MVEESNSDKPHFVKEINYSKEPWRTDFIFGKKGDERHLHIALSGNAIFFLHDSQGTEIIVDGVVKNTSQ